MPLRDQAAMERSLDNDYGPTRAAAAPASFEVALFIGDPVADGVEVSSTSEVNDNDGGTYITPNGYARAVLDNDDWNPASDGIKTSSPVAFPATLAEYPDTVTHVGLYDPVGQAWWDVVPLTEPLDITSAGDPPVVVIAVFYDNNADSIID